LQVKLCDPCLSALCVPWCKKTLHKYSSFPFLYPWWRWNDPSCCMTLFAASALQCIFKGEENPQNCPCPLVFCHPAGAGLSHMHRKTGNKSSAVAEMGDNRVGLSRVGQPTSVPSDILIHAAVRPQQTCQKLGGSAPFLQRGLGYHRTQSPLG